MDFEADQLIESAVDEHLDAEGRGGDPLVFERMAEGAYVREPTCEDVSCDPVVVFRTTVEEAVAWADDTRWQNALYRVRHREPTTERRVSRRHDRPRRHGLRRVRRRAGVSRGSPGRPAGEDPEPPLGSLQAGRAPILLRGVRTRGSGARLFLTGAGTA